jgi:hypothetical protein
LVFWGLLAVNAQVLAAFFAKKVQAAGRQPPELFSF